MTKIAGLAMTAEDHLKIGSTPPTWLTDNPGKRWHESFDDQALHNWIAESVMFVAAQHQKALGGNEREVRILGTQLNGFLGPNLAYLKEIGRLPEGLEEFDPQVAFAVPEPTGFYYLTGKSADGKVMVSCYEDESGWQEEQQDMDRNALVNAVSMLKAVSHASAHQFTDVWVHHVVVGRRLSGEEIRALRREHERPGNIG